MATRSCSYFGLSVAGYPEGHIDWFKDSPVISEENYRKDLQVLVTLRAWRSAGRDRGRFYRRPC